MDTETEAPDEAPISPEAPVSDPGADLIARQDALRKQVLAICPSSLREFAEAQLDGWLLEDLDLVGCRSLLLAEWRARQAAATGTPEPQAPKSTRSESAVDEPESKFTAGVWTDALRR